MMSRHIIDVEVCFHINMHVRSNKTTTRPSARI